MQGVSVLNKVANYEIVGIPAGAVVMGAVVGGVGDVATGVIQSFVPSIPTFAIKGLLAIGVGKYGKKLIGETGASVGALFLAYDAVQSLVDIRGKTAGFVGGIVGKVKGVAKTVATSTTSSSGSAF